MDINRRQKAPISLTSYSNTSFVRMLKRASFQKRFAAFTLLFMLFQILSPFGSLISQKKAKADIATVTIGTQTWMASNLDVGDRIDAGTTQTDNSTVEKYCYDNNPANCTTYGGLYQWDEMMQYSTAEGAKGICPVDFHVPTDAEWTTLADYLGSNTGTQLKVDGSSGFEGLLGGYSDDSSFYGFNDSGFFASSTEENASSAWRFALNSGSNVDRDSISKSSGYSVRCLQNVDVTPTPTVIASPTPNITMSPLAGTSAAPTITNVSHNHGNPESTNSVIITWDTSEASSSQVDYGTTPDLGTLTTLNADPVVNHAVTITGLTSGTTYYARVISADADGNSNTSPCDAITIPGIASTPTPTPTVTPAPDTDLPITGPDVTKVILNIFLAVLALSLIVLLSKKTKYAYLLN